MSFLKRYFILIAIVLLAILLVTAYMVRVYPAGHGLYRTIPSDNMWPTLKSGDRLLYEHVPQDEDLERGNILLFFKTFKHFPNHPETFTGVFSSRLIAIPGDRVEVSFDGIVHVNGKAVSRRKIDQREYKPQRGRTEIADIYEECHSSGICYEISDLIDRPNQPFAERVLGPNEYFVLGDNRDNSNDSRFVRTWGFVQRDGVFGRNPVRLFSLPKLSDLLTSFLSERQRSNSTDHSGFHIQRWHLASTHGNCQRGSMTPGALT